MGAVCARPGDQQPPSCVCVTRVSMLCMALSCDPAAERCGRAAVGRCSCSQEGSVEAEFRPGSQTSPQSGVSGGCHPTQGPLAQGLLLTTALGAARPEDSVTSCG